MMKYRKKVTIAGYGIVGHAMHAVLGRAHDVAVYDPPKGFADLDVLQYADLIVVCVPTPARPDNGDADLDALFTVTTLIEMQRSKSLVCIKSTVPPGTVDTLNGRADTDRYHFSPEYTHELPNYVDASKYLAQDSASHPFCIVGGPRASEVLEFFSRCMATAANYITCRAIEAELCKYIDNTYIATKVTFCAEWNRIAETYGVDYMTLRNLWLQDPRVDPSHTLVFQDNPGFDGKCLPKDLSAIINAAAMNGYTPHLLRSVQWVNSLLRQKEKGLSNDHGRK